MKRGSAITEGIVGTCAIVTLGVVLGRWAGRPAATAAVSTDPIDAWEEVVNGGQRIGPEDARVVLATFSDFQCPWCAEFARAFREAGEQDPQALALVYRHYPLTSIHPFADTAAIAAECAGEQDRFAAYHDALYEAQDRIGVMPWDSLARATGIPDTEAFEACVAEGRPASRVAADVALGDRIGVQGTPTVFADGVPLPGPWTAEQLLGLAARR